ncbi:MAG: hypothetical protein IPJ34_33110 [Myxococcales bacterium]|nr:hypothetical protein [Myxococcales bacterium]
MRARSHVAVAGVAASLGAIAACSLTTDFSGVSDKPDATSGAEHAVPPSRPAGAPGKGGGITLFLGVKHFHFAHSNDALKVPGAWQDWGFDLDGLCTSSLAADQKGVCIRRPGATPDMVQDGKACRDNNFGSAGRPQAHGLRERVRERHQRRPRRGHPHVDPRPRRSGSGADDPYVPGRLYLAARTPDKVRPAWDGTDARKILTSSVKGGKIDDPVITFPKGYLKGNVWVSGEAADLSLSLPIGKAGVLMPLVAQHAVIAFRLKDDHASAVDGTGQFAGAMPMSSLESFLAPFLASQTTFCPGSPQYKSFMDSLAPFADVSLGAASLQDEKSACDGVSFGIGINLAPIAVPTETAPPESDPPCGTVSDAGSDAAADVGDAATDTAPDATDAD